MMGYSHAVSGALAAAALVAIEHATGHTVNLPTTAVSVIATAGAAMIPDTDHPEASAAHIAGPVSRLICKGIARASGGHRHGTHTLAFALGAGGASAALSFVAARHHAPWLLLPAVFILLALAASGLHKLLRRSPLVLAALGTAAILQAFRDGSVGVWWLPITVTLGCLAHILGDCLTVEGCPLWYPLVPMHRHVCAGFRWNGRHVSILGHAGSPRELRVFVPLMSVATVGLLALSLR